MDSGVSCTPDALQHACVLKPFNSALFVPEALQFMTKIIESKVQGIL